MKIINRDTGHIFIIEKGGIDTISNSILYTEYETIVFKKELVTTEIIENGEISEVTHENIIKVKEFKLGTKRHKFTTINLGDKIYDDTLDLVFIISSLVSELEMSNVEIATEEVPQNWLFPERFVRVIIHKDTISEHEEPLSVVDNVATYSDLHNLINRVKKEHFGFYKNNKNDKSLVIYLNTVTSEDAEVISEYIGSDIWIETNLNV